MKRSATFRSFIILAALAGIFSAAFFFVPVLHAHADAGTSAKSTDAADVGSCANTSWFGGGLTCFLYHIPEKMGLFVLEAAGWILWLAGVSFQAALRLTLSIRYLINSTNGSGIRVAWAALRDLTNIMFIFMMLYMSIETILDRPNSYKKLLKPLVVAAVFINFSFFIAGVVIDASNIIAIGVYDAILPSAPLPTGTDIFTASSIAADGQPGTISAQFLGFLHLNTVFDSRGIAGSDSEKLKVAQNVGVSGTNTLISIIMGIIIVLVAAFVFFTAAVLLIVRTVTLIFILATAPMAYMGNVLPRLKKESDKWDSSLWDQSFFAPAYLICLYVSLQILKSLKVETLAGRGGPVGLIFGDIMVIFFLLTSIKVANDFGAYGADIAKEYGGKASFGIGGWVGRQTVGRASAAIGRSGVLGNTISTKLRDIGTNSTFDLRNIKQFGGKDVVGVGGKDGFTKERDKIIDEKIRLAEARKPDKKESADINARKAARIDAYKELNNGEDPEEKMKRDQKAIKAAINATPTDAKVQAAIDNLKKESKARTDAAKAEIRGDSGQTAAEIEAQHAAQKARESAYATEVSNKEAKIKNLEAQISSNVFAPASEKLLFANQLANEKRDLDRLKAEEGQELQKAGVALAAQKAKIERSAQEIEQKESKLIEEKIKELNARDRDIKNQAIVKAQQKLQDKFDDEFPSAKVVGNRRMKDFAARELSWGFKIFGANRAAAAGIKDKTKDETVEQKLTKLLKEQAKNEGKGGKGGDKDEDEGGDSEEGKGGDKGKK